MKNDEIKAWALCGLSARITELETELKEKERKTAVYDGRIFVQIQILRAKKTLLEYGEGAE